MSLEQVSERALDYLKKVGYPTGVMELTEAEKDASGWKLVFSKLFTQVKVELRTDVDGTILSLRSLNGK